MVNAKIVIQPGEPIEASLRKFKKEMEKGDVMREYRRAESFVPKAERRKTKSRKAAARKIVKQNPLYDRPLTGPEWYG